MVTEIFKRDVIDEITQYLQTDNIIVLHGARQVGKTHILYYLQDLLQAQNKTFYFFDLEDSRWVELLNSGVEMFLSFLKNEGFDLENFQKQNKKLFLFIDEIQYLQDPSPFLKLLADHHKYLQLIVSGSSSFDIKTKFSDSLVGRTVNFEIFPLSFQEFLRFKKLPYDLSASLADPQLEKVKTLYQEYVYYGAYPKIVLEDSTQKKEKYLQQIIDTYIKKDVRDLANIKDVQKFNNLLKLLASQSGQLLNVAQLSKHSGLAQQTVEHYIFILENTYVIKLLRPLSKSSKIEVVKAPKVFFYDTGLAQMLWLKNLQKNLLGNMLETSVFAELVKKYGIENIYFWRTKNQQEIDFILQNRGEILPIEVKQTFQKVSKATLESFCRKYGATRWIVVGLNGEKEPHFQYPWEI